MTTCPGAFGSIESVRKSSKLEQSVQGLFLAFHTSHCHTNTKRHMRLTCGQCYKTFPGGILENLDFTINQAARTVPVKDNRHLWC